MSRRTNTAVRIGIACALALSALLPAARASAQKPKSVRALLTKAVTKAPAKPAAKAPPLTAARINGSYRSNSNEIRILALSASRLKVQYDLTYEYDTANGRSADTGFATGEATLDGNVATYRSTEFGSPCTITLKFEAGNKLSVTAQSSPGECGFGNRASPDGAYRKAKPGKPKFKASAEDAEGSAQSSAPEMTAVPASEVTERYGRDADEAFIKQPAILKAMRHLDSDFDGFGVPGDNAAVRLKTGEEILLMCGRSPRAMGQAAYYVAYDPAKRTIYFTRAGNDGGKEYGSRDATLKAAHAHIATTACP